MMTDEPTPRSNNISLFDLYNKHGFEGVGKQLTLNWVADFTHATVVRIIQLYFEEVKLPFMYYGFEGDNCGLVNCRREWAYGKNSVPICVDCDRYPPDYVARFYGTTREEEGGKWCDYQLGSWREKTLLWGICYRLVQ